jgi:hypothetical protein
MVQNKKTAMLHFVMVFQQGHMPFFLPPYINQYMKIIFEPSIINIMHHHMNNGRWGQNPLANHFAIY